MFWSEAAVEKFMFPYYVRFSSPDHIARMRRAFNQERVVAAMHVPWSTSSFLVSVRGGEALSTLTLEELEAERRIAPRTSDHF